jgi:hypothetical protein
MPHPPWQGCELAPPLVVISAGPAQERFVLLRSPSQSLLHGHAPVGNGGRTAKPARRAEGRMPGVKRSNQEKGYPAYAPRGHSATAPALPYLGHPCPRHARQVREAGPGFSTGLLSWRKGTGVLPVPLRALSSRPARLPKGPWDGSLRIASCQCISPYFCFELVTVLRAGGGSRCLCRFSSHFGLVLKGGFDVLRSPSHFLLLGRDRAGSAGERRSWPEGRRAGCPE